MKVLKNYIDSKTASGSIALEMTCVEDAYVLSDTISVGDVVEATTTRKLSLDGGRSQQKITLTLAVSVEATNFDLVSGIVDLKGKVTKENEYVRQGSYHTLHLSIGDSFKISKNKWTRHAISQLHGAAKDTPAICIVVFFDRECVISTVSSIGVKNLFKDEIKNKNFKRIYTCISSIKDSVKTLVIAGFSGIRTDFYKELIREFPQFEKQSTVIKLSGDYKGLSNAKVINKMLLDKEFSRSFSELQYVDDLREVKEFLKDVSTDSSLVGIGMKEVKEALDYGALRKVFVTDRVYRPSTLEERREMEAIVSQAKELRAKICVIPAQHEYGERLTKLGGIACLLLFEYR